MADLPTPRPVIGTKLELGRGMGRVAYDALTVRQPWAHAIAHLGKHVENRGWSRARAISLIGQLIAIHAGQKVDEDAVALLRGRGLEVPDRLPTSAIVAVARVELVLDTAAALRLYPEHTAWITGPLCIVFGQVIALERPVLCAGALYLWLLPDRVRLAVADQVRDQVIESPVVRRG